MDYNTSRSRLKLAEYGRSIQLMVEALGAIPDRDKRSIAASQIIKIMTQITSEQKDSKDHTQKLWDDLYAMSGYKLDIDSPVELIKPDASFDKAAVKPSYGHHRIKIKVYGRYMQEFATKLGKYEEVEEKGYHINRAASLMKIMQKSFGDEKVPDILICQQLTELSEGNINIQGYTDVLSAYLPSNPSAGNGKSILNGNPARNKKKKKKNGRIQPSQRK